MSNPPNKIKIGTRASKLALWQAHWVQSELLKFYPNLQIEIVKITTTGDRVVDRKLSEIGGKGLFIKEIEEALLRNEVDVAVHSSKDLPGDLAAGLVLAAVPQRASSADVLISRDHVSFNNLKKNALIGSSSVRRQCQIKSLRPDLQFVNLRGNIDTRLRKLKEGEVDAIILARAGLDRLELSKEITEELNILPAVGQGTLAIEARNDDLGTIEMLKVLNDPISELCLNAEREFLRMLNGNCNTPVACYVRFEGSAIKIDAILFHPDGRMIKKSTMTNEREVINESKKIAEEILDSGGKEILQSL